MTASAGSNPNQACKWVVFITLDPAQEVIQPTVESEKSGKAPRFSD